WQKGLVDSLRFNADMLFNPMYGRIGMIAMPYYLIYELAGGIVELFGYALLLVFYFAGVLSLQWTLMFILFATAINFLFTVATLLLEELSFDRYTRARDLAMLLWGGFLYNFGY